MKNEFPDSLSAYGRGIYSGYLLLKLVKFISVLRGLGIRVSVGEATDALGALSWIDLLDRGQVKLALGATLIKNLSDRKVFDLAFDVFFDTPGSGPANDKEDRYKFAPPDNCPREGEDDFIRRIKRDERNWGKELLNILHFTVEENESRNITRGAAKKEFIRTIDKLQHDGCGFASALPVAKMAESSLQQWRKRMMEHAVKIGALSSGLQILSAAERDRGNAAEELVRKVASDLEMRKEEASILAGDMKNIAERDMPRASLLIKKLSQRLATRISKRYFSRHRRGKLDIRRTIRRNIGFGGIMMQLKHRSPKLLKPRLLLISDVSGSMACYAVFVIEFLYGLSRVIRDIETFIFAEGLERVTPLLKKRGKGFVRTISHLLEESEQWGKGTDMHSSLEVFLRQYRPLLTPDIFVIIVSDAQTLHPDMVVANLKEIRQHVKDIIWLNTMPCRDWKQWPEIFEFRKYCRMFECSTLEQLGKVLGSQMLAI